jgi:hypothetical protein
MSILFVRIFIMRSATFTINPLFGFYEVSFRENGKVVEKTSAWTRERCDRIMIDWYHKK